jgi:hypothetical protein
MDKDGHWLNYKTRQIRLIDDHENWMRRPENWKVIGIPSDMMEGLCADYTPRIERELFLLCVLVLFPLIRVRGHGVSVTFEFYSLDQESLVLEAIVQSCQRTIGVGNHTCLKIVNFASQRFGIMSYKGFRKRLKAGTDCLPISFQYPIPRTEGGDHDGVF